MIRKLIVVGAFAALLAACGGHSASPDLTRPQVVVDALRQHGFTVTDVKEDNEAALFVRESVDATIDGVAVYIHTFGDSDGAESWAKVSSAFGGIAVVGPTWAVSLDTTGDTPRSRSQDLATKIAKALNGTVR